MATNNKPSDPSGKIARHALYEVMWRKDHPQLSELLDTMLPCSLQQEAVSGLDSGYLSPKIQYQLENLIKPVVLAPMRDTSVTGIQGSIHKMYFDTRPSSGEKFYRADFSTREGWNGRIETTDTNSISILTGTLLHSQVEISGWVSWSRDSYAILIDPVTIVRLSSDIL